MMVSTAAFIFFTLFSNEGSVGIRSSDVLDVSPMASGTGCAILLSGDELDTYVAASCDDVKAALSK